MVFALLSPRDLAIGTEVAMIVAGVWFARFARKSMRELTGKQPVRKAPRRSTG